MSTQASTLYPPGGFAAPKYRRGRANGNHGLPTGTEVFSADTHISLAADIFYERFPADLKDEAPRIWHEDGAYQVGQRGQSFLPDIFTAVLMQYDDRAGATTSDIDARVRELRDDGVDKELAFPNAVLALFHFADKQLRERVFRIYNEYIAELQERSNGHFFGVGLINWWEPHGTERTLAELKSLGLKTFLLPLNPGNDDDDNPIDYSVPHLRRHPGAPPEAAYRVVRGWYRLGATGAAGRRARPGVLPAHAGSPAGRRHPLLLGNAHVRLVHGRSARSRQGCRRCERQHQEVLGHLA